MPSFFTILSVASTVSKAFLGYQQAAAMKAYYDAQADLAGVRARITKVQAQEDANQALRDLNENLSSNVARAAAGGISPYIGSPATINAISTRYGVQDYLLARDTAKIADSMGIMEAQILRDAGDMYNQGGLIGAFADVGIGVYNIFSQTGGLTSPFYNTGSILNPTASTVVGGTVISGKG
jgi:hypothetical protein